MPRDKTVAPLQSFLFYIQFLFLRLLFFIFNLIPPETASQIADKIGALLFLRKRRREFSIYNLEKAFPGKSQKEIEAIGRGSMQSMIEVIFEFMRIPSIAKKPGSFIEMQGEEHVRQALKEGRGLVLAVSHFGNWELSGIATASKGFPLHAIGKFYKNPWLNPLIRKQRGMTGLQTIDQKGAARKTIQLIKENQIVAMLIDEHAKNGAVWVNFFGQKAATSALPAMVALKYHTPVVPVVFYREKKRRSRVVFDKPFPLIETGQYEADIVANTQLYMSHLEEELKKRPEDWTLWMHNRWRWDDRDSPGSPVSL